VVVFAKSSMMRNIFGQCSTAQLVGCSIAVAFTLNIGGQIQLPGANAVNLSLLSPLEQNSLAGTGFLVEESSPLQTLLTNQITNNYLAGVLGSAVALLPSYARPQVGPDVGLLLTPSNQNPGEFNPQDYSLGYQYGYFDGSSQNPFGYSYGYVNPYSQSFQIGYNDGYPQGFAAVTGVSPFASPLS
jgi:hypothetical protein